MSLSKQDKINLLKDNLNNIPDDQINRLYKKYIDNKNNNNKKNKEVNKDKIDKTADKYKLALKFVNKILHNIDKPQITDLADFKKILRNDIIKTINKKTFEDMEDELFKYFDKRTCGWYRRKQIKDPVLPFLRGMCKELGYSLNYSQIDVRKNNVTKTHMYYSINP